MDKCFLGRFRGQGLPPAHTTTEAKKEDTIKKSTQNTSEMFPSIPLVSTKRGTTNEKRRPLATLKNTKTVQHLPVIDAQFGEIVAVEGQGRRLTDAGGAWPIFRKWCIDGHAHSAHHSFLDRHHVQLRRPVLVGRARDQLLGLFHVQHRGRQMRIRGSASGIARVGEDGHSTTSHGTQRSTQSRNDMGVGPSSAVHVSKQAVVHATGDSTSFDAGGGRA